MMQLHLKQSVLSFANSHPTLSKGTLIPPSLEQAVLSLDGNSTATNHPPFLPQLPSSDLSSYIEMILKQANLSQSETNIEIVTKLLIHQMPVTKPTIQSILTNHKAHKHIPLDYLVLSQKNQGLISKRAIGELTRFTVNEPNNPNNLEQVTTKLMTLLEHPECFETTTQYQSYCDTVMNVLKESFFSLQIDSSPTVFLSNEIHLPITTENETVPTVLSNDYYGTTNDRFDETNARISSFLPDSPKEAVTKLTFRPVIQSLPTTLSTVHSSTSKATLTYDIKSLFLELFSIPPKQLGKKDSALQHIQSVTKQLEELIKKTKDFLPKEQKEEIELQYESITKTTSDLPMCSEHCTYIQLPIRLNEQTVPSDLYIIKQKPNESDSTSSVTVLLHLNLTHLKNLDIFLHLSSNVLSASFYTEEDCISTLLKQHITKLSDRLSKHSITFHSNFFTRKQDQTILSELQQEINDPMKPYPTSFDIRT